MDLLYFSLWYFIKHERDTTKDKLIEQIKDSHCTELNLRNEMIEQWKKYAD
jgi:hypothetical protein